jgi:hypothetical protein
LGATTGGITWAHITTTDVITIAGQSIPGSAGRVCVVNGISAGTSFRIDCSANPGIVWNVMVVRH